MTNKEYVLEAIKVAERLKHCKHYFFKDDDGAHANPKTATSCCTFGALHLVNNWQGIPTAVINALEEAAGKDMCAIVEWNDSFNIGKEDVVALLKKTAEIVED